MLTFDEELHIYYWDDVRVPNVTLVLDSLTDYSVVPPAALELARQKGVAVHKMVELDIKDDLDEDGLPEWMRPVLLQWRQFVADTGFVPVASETKLYHKKFSYAGAMDIYGHILDNPAFIDVKRSFFAGQVIGYQIAAYKHAYIDSHLGDKTAKKARRYALRLHENKRYELEEYKDETGDFNKFLTCLNYYRIKEELKCNK